MECWREGQEVRVFAIVELRAQRKTNRANEYRKASVDAFCQTRCIWRTHMVRVLRSALPKEMMEEPKYDERESMMFMDVVLNASESRRCSDGRMRRGRRRDAATERGRREAHIVGAGET